jgi:predicted acylesterase/phospholipase RssA
MSDGQTQDAVVLTGSGANAAYEVGVLKGLLSGPWGKDANSAIRPFCYSGTSCGALNSAVMASMANLSPEIALERLESMWMDRIALSAGSATGLFRIRWDPTQYANKKYLADFAKPMIDLGLDFLHVAKEVTQRIAVSASNSGSLADSIVQLGEFSELLDITPLRQTVRDMIDTQQIAANEEICKLRITAVDWQKGTPKTFENKHFATAYASEIIFAALALPCVVRPQVVDGIPYVDTCVLMNTPLKPAIAAGSKEPGARPLVLHVVYVDSAARDIPRLPLSNTFATLYRLYMLALSRSILTDIERADAVNERIWMRDLLQTIGQGAGVKQQAGIGLPTTGIRDRMDRDLKSKVNLTVHRYAPTEHTYGFELAQFEKSTIEQLIQHGHDAVLHHNCDESRCIRPENPLS